MRSWLLALLLAGCSAGGGNSDTCTLSTCALGGHTYKFCGEPGGASCAYITGDGKRFDCASCANCSAAAQEMVSWCTGTLNNGTTTGSTTTTGTTTTTTTTSGSTTSATGSGSTGIGSTSSSTTSSSTTSSGGTTSTSPEDLCNNCFDTAQLSGAPCASQLLACQNDATCMALITCLNACDPSDTTCNQQCYTTAGPAATQLLDADFQCGCTACATPCAMYCTSSS